MEPLRLRDVAQRHGPAYLARHGDAILPSHAAALRAIAECQTAKRGGHLAQCTHCGCEHVLLNSCRHRACPRCGHTQTERWLERQRDALLPVPYFHVVFTLPAELRRFVRTHQKALLSALFHAAFAAVATLCRDPQHLGATRIGALAVLHTWTRTLEWHPHIHMLVPGGGLAADGRTWRATRKRRKGFLVSVRQLSLVFRAIFMRRARSALPTVVFPDSLLAKRWVVFAKAVVQGTEKVLAYLGRYVHRTAIGDRAIVGVSGDAVTFSYRPSGATTPRLMSLPADEFLRRFLQHVSPRGFHRVRAYGLLHPTQRSRLRGLQLLLARTTPPPARLPDSASPPEVTRASLTAARRCPSCHQATLVILRSLTSYECLALLAAPAVSLSARHLSPGGPSP